MLNKVTKTLSLVALVAVFTVAVSAQTGGSTTGAPAPSTTAAANPAANAPAAATPAGPAPTKVGVINIQAVILRTNEGQRDFEALSKKYEPKSKEIDSLAKEIEALKGQLQSQTEKLNEAERATRVRSLEQKQKAYQRNLEDAQGEFEKERNEVLNRIGVKLLQVVDQFAKQNNLAMVVNAGGDGDVLWASDRVNISQPVLEMYNQSSGVPAPAADAPSAQRPNTPPAAPKKPTTPSNQPR